MKKLSPVFTAVFITVMMFSVTNASDIKRIDNEALAAMLGNPDLVLVDVRKAEDWNSSEFKIKGALREEPDQVTMWMNKYAKNKTLVFYCA